MSLLGLKTFRHGVHPPEAKDDTKGMAIRQFPFAPLLVVPLVQHAGKPSLPVVREGQEVARGQRIARPDGFLSVAMHAPASGTVAQDRPRAGHQRPDGAGGLSRAVPGLDAGGVRGQALPARRPGGRDPRRHPGGRHRRSRRRRLPDPRQAQGPRGQGDRHPDPERRRVRAVPDHRPPGDARAARRHLHRHPLPEAGHRRRPRDHRRRVEQAGCGGAPARRGAEGPIAGWAGRGRGR